MSINCSSGHPNPDGSFYCDTCGELLSMDSAAHQIVRVCSHCGLPNSPGADICAQCESPLSPPPLPETSLPEHVAGACLIVLSDSTIYSIIHEDTIIGRVDPTANSLPDIDLTAHGGEDGGISRVHARLCYKDGHFTIEDQHSLNYTFLNKQRLEPYIPTPIKSGDELRLGRILLRFEIQRQQSE
jgi:hypothetical protein